MTTNDQRPSHVVETASATTDPNNSHSGNFAYVIAALAIVGSLGLGFGLKGCVGMVADIVREVNDGSDVSNVHPLEDSPDGQDIDDWWNDLGDDGMGTDQPNGDDFDLETTQPIADIIGSDLAMFDHTIDGSLSASDYANTEPAISSYVRELVVTDKNASAELATMLHNAAWGEGDLDEALKSAIEKADATMATIRGMKPPKSESKNSSTIATELDDARDDALGRWESIKEELEVFEGSEQLSRNDIVDLEDEVTEAADNAAGHLLTALKSSRDR